ncbi:hypothetical protein [Nocardioides sp. NPDC006273]|uniref:hypothetical protein n=1 Tax=Nocardioides sp. NPDC006273 TaxID=3155598 RepID=UPI0033A5C9D9
MRHDVMQLAGDPGAFRGAGLLGDPEAPFGLGGPGGAQPGAGGPHEGQHQVERQVPDRPLGPAEQVERERQQHVGTREEDRDRAATVFQVGTRAQQRDDEPGPRQRVVAPELVEDEAE